MGDRHGRRASPCHIAVRRSGPLDPQQGLIGVLDQQGEGIAVEALAVVGDAIEEANAFCDQQLCGLPLLASAKTTLDAYGHLWPDRDDTSRAAVAAVYRERTPSGAHCD
ncbi:hypothetical protein GCM10027076_19990 [Nocardioides montaniterrae]